MATRWHQRVGINLLRSTYYIVCIVDTQKGKMSKTDRIYTLGEEAYPSVTTIIKNGIPKPALMKWAAKLVATAALEQRAKLDTFEDPADAIKWLTDLPNQRANTSAVKGTAVHKSSELLARGLDEGVVPVEARGHVDQYIAFLNDFAPVTVHTEVTVYNRTLQYAGTVDAVMAFDGRPCILDTKTGKGVYSDVALQLAAYDNAEFYLGPDGEELPWTPTGKAYVLHLQADKYELRPVNIGKVAFDTFLAAYDVMLWDKNEGRVAIGNPIEPKEK